MPPRPKSIDRFIAFVFRWSSRLPLEEFDLRATFPGTGDRALIGERIAQALRLLRTHSLLRYQYLHRDLPRILVSGADGLGACHDAVGVCLLRYEFVVATDTTPEKIALVLVHEGMHARLTRAGFAYDDTVRARVERLCAKAEILLAGRLPGGDHAAWARTRLSWPDTMWSRSAIAERQRRSLQALGWEGRFAYRVTATIRSIRERLGRRAA